MSETDDDVRMASPEEAEGETPAMRVARLKAEMRSAINDYRLGLSEDYPCGANMQAYLRPKLGEKARQVNALAQQLMEADPDGFPSTWTPLPEGT